MRRTLKTPQQKTRERSPRKKAVVHRAERRIAHQALAATVAHEDLELPDAVEPRLKRKRLQVSRAKKARAAR